jgi:hypothetical protein
MSSLLKQRVMFYSLVAMTATSCDCNDDPELPPDEVYVRVKPGIDFSQYETFRINDELSSGDLADAGVDPDDIPGDVRLNIDTANDQARIELEARGLTAAASGAEADLVIVSLGSTQDEDAIYWECVPGYWWGYWSYVWDTCAWLEPVYVEYTIGSVAVGLVDETEQDVVFGGLLQGVADGSGDSEERIRDGVREMFEEYPE